MPKRKINFFNQVFNKKKEDETTIKLGKYSDRNKSLEQLNWWAESIEFYDNNEYLKSAEKFFLFVKNPDLNNLNFTKKDEKIDFNFFQGSKKISGYINNEKLYASSDIATVEENISKIAESLLKINYDLKFCKFSLDKNKIVCELMLHSSHSNPFTLYYALREIAITSDKYDDSLMIDFNNLKPINNSHITSLDKNELDTKIIFFKNITKELIETLYEYDSVKFAGARAFLMLAYIYKITYLLSPEGILLEKINYIIAVFYQNDDDIDIEKNAKIYKHIKELSEISEEQLKNSFYFVSSTFPVVPPSEPEQVTTFLKKEIDKIHWYDDNGHKKVAIAITDYIIGYSCYHLGNEPIIDELFKIYWEIMDYKYFETLKIKHIPVEKNKISYFVLNNRINTINWIAKKSYSDFLFNIKHLNIDSNQQFAKSFIYEFINLNFSKKTKD